jgi:high affinity Mn2+ porin
VVFNPEIAGGRGFSNVLGVAGFLNGEITRVGTVEPTPYIARLFLRETWGLDCGREKIEDAPNLIAGVRDTNRVVLSVGKFAATDVVDDRRSSGPSTTWRCARASAWPWTSRGSTTPATTATAAQSPSARSGSTSSSDPRPVWHGQNPTQDASQPVSV